MDMTPLQHNTEYMLKNNLKMFLRVLRVVSDCLLVIRPAERGADDYWNAVCPSAHLSICPSCRSVRPSSPLETILLSSLSLRNHSSDWAETFYSARQWCGPVRRGHIYWFPWKLNICRNCSKWHNLLRNFIGFVRAISQQVFIEFI